MIFVHHDIELISFDKARAGSACVAVELQQNASLTKPFPFPSKGVMELGNKQ
jgi:hypothetical protein